MNKKTHLSFFACLLLVAGTLSGQTISQAHQSVDDDLRTAIQRLAQLRETIRAEQVPLNRELNELEGELRIKRREVERAQRLRDTQAVDLGALQAAIAARRDEIDYLSNLTSEFGTTTKARMDLAEVQIYRDRLGAFASAAEDTLLNRAQRLEAQLFITLLATQRLQELIGGRSFSGRAVTPSGELEEGTFVLFGPIKFFASKETSLAGLSQSVGSIEPSITPLGVELDGRIREFAQNQSGLLPLDATLGNALAILAAETTLWGHIQQGGIWIWPILTIAFLAFVSAVFKAVEIYSVKMPPPGSLHEVLRLMEEQDFEAAAAAAAAVPGPAGQMLSDAVAHRDESKELIEEVMYERMLEVQPKLERLLPFIAVTAATAPLMGLLGTVTGMINTFKLITIFGTGDARNLSSGISEALVTTEFGLIVAIPSLILHALLARRAQGVMADLERIAVAFVNGLPRRNGHS